MFNSSLNLYKQILGDWYWNTKINLLVHKCSEIDKSHTIQIDSKIICVKCEKESPQAIVDIYLLCNIKSWYSYRTIKGRWGVGKGHFISKPYLAHRCRGKVYPYYRSSIRCKKCNIKVPKYIIKYCKENNVPV